MLPATADHLDLLSGHHYTERKFRAPLSTDDARHYEASFAPYSASVLEGVRRVVTDFRQRTGPGSGVGDRVRLAVDEWGIVRDWNPAPDSPGLGPFEHYYPLGDALAAARALHELIRSADVVAMANWAQMVNVIGAIKTSRNFAMLDSVGHVLALYRARVGGELLPVKLSADVPVDAVAALDSKSGRVALGLANYSPSQEVTLSLMAPAGKLAPKGRGWRINGPSIDAISIPGRPPLITTEALERLDLAQPVWLPPHSITVISSERSAR
jgi:alpha-N-arabinofuranosidase